MQQSFGGIIAGKAGIPVIPQTSQKREKMDGGGGVGEGSEAVCHPGIGGETFSTLLLPVHRTEQSMDLEGGMHHF